MAQDDPIGEIRFWQELIDWYRHHRGEEPPRRVYQALDLAIARATPPAGCGRDDALH